MESVNRLGLTQSVPAALESVLRAISPLFASACLRSTLTNVVFVNLSVVPLSSALPPCPLENATRRSAFCSCYGAICLWIIQIMVI
uniref:Uncharacterized protein n=2 Tax=Canis lupus familiaris TaxID=9615 RepID=A0A8C0TJF3_CANLF